MNDKPKRFEKVTLRKSRKFKRLQAEKQQPEPPKTDKPFKKKNDNDSLIQIW